MNAKKSNSKVSTIQKLYLFTFHKFSLIRQICQNTKNLKIRFQNMRYLMDGEGKFCLYE